VRVYLPLTTGLLARARDRGRFDAGPARAVGPGLADALATTDVEELEYAASQGAAQDALRLLDDTDRPLRLVAALEVDRVEPDPEGDPSLVLVGEVPLRRLAAVLADAAEAAGDVAAARASLRAGAPDSDPVVERCLDHELRWYGAQELDLLSDPR
jgi:hypothetical protein